MLDKILKINNVTKLDSMQQSKINGGMSSCFVFCSTDTDCHCACGSSSFCTDSGICA